MSKRVKVIIVCPPNSGGQFVHAMNLTLSIDSELYRAVVLTKWRRGLNKYRFKDGRSGVKGVLFPDLHGNWLIELLDRWLLSAVNILLVNIYVLLTGAKVVINESPTIPIFVKFKKQNITFQHNKVDHSYSAVPSKFRDKTLEILKAASLSRSDKIFTHSFARFENKKVTFLNLPGYGPFQIFEIRESKKSMDSDILESFYGQFVLLGQIRRNKGITEFLNSYSGRYKVAILGRKVDEEYFLEISQLIKRRSLSKVTLLDIELSEFEFYSVLCNCRALILPYINFESSSGLVPLAKSVGANVLYSDLPSLKLQLKGYEKGISISAGDIPSWDFQMEKLHKSISPKDSGKTQPQGDEMAWRDLANEVLS